MTSRSLVLGLVAAGCLTAAAGGSYLAVRHNARGAQGFSPADTSSPEGPLAPSTPAVNETEALIESPAQPEAADVPEPVEAAPPAVSEPPKPRRATPRREPIRRPAAAAPTRAATAVVPAEEPRTTVPVAAAYDPAPVAPVERSQPAEISRPYEPPPPAEPVFDEIVLPASSVIGLELETSVTSEQAQVEDRVDARVTRDVYADGRLVIPAGSRVRGAVTLVERGGKVKERARLGVRFHTLVLADGRAVPLRTETVYRDGESPANDSSRKIGGAAIGGAVLGAILGGGKGAIAGATAGAAGGTAAVMAGGRKAAMLPNGTVLTVKLAEPAAIEVER